MALTDRQKYRLLEIFPGALLWGVFILSIILSFVRPIWVVYFIIVFTVYWLFRVTYFVFYMVYSWRRYKCEVNTDWMAKLNELSNWRDYYHMIFIPTAGEPLEVLRTTLNSITANEMPLDKFILVLAGEGRKADDFLPKAEILEKEYGRKFFKFIVTVHPDGVIGEIKGKGSNANYAGRESKKIIDGLGIPYEKIIVSYFDCDTCVHPKYFSCLTYKYATHPNPTRTSFQPVALYNNNIWNALFFTRITAFGTTFWLMTELARPDRLFTFSSHSMSYKALVDVGFWQKDIVSDDSRIFLQCLIHYDGEYSVAPMHIPISMDTVMAGNIWESVKNLYKQQRRWAWGIENFPFMVYHFLRNKKIPLFKKIKYTWNQTEGMFSWASAPILLFVLGRLPLLVASETIKTEAIIQNAPLVLEKLMVAAMLGILVSAIFGLLLMPPPPAGKGRYTYLILALQWIFLPVTLIIFGSLPAIDAQTRLMFGKYLGFWVTEKIRK
ncbi:MAG: glycosyltransferase family 2 protein [Patescibacteria group bacterium]|nr:glycosyltransferase family 2 protein [Patescibacteria group bacterium]MDD5490377.1 glycosyltransferase family 2 protein [Patescibacteria group bacterium]